MLMSEQQGYLDMTAGEIRLPAYGKDPGTLKAAERQAREARQDAERYARRGNMTMHAISLQAAKELEAAAAAHRTPEPKERR
jgi:regulator of protease activity HflC (stomatin/prohibitin superfamily)